MVQAKTSKQYSEEAEEILNQSKNRLKDELAHFANSLVQVADLQALAVSTLRQEFERDHEEVKQWLEEGEHD